MSFSDDNDFEKREYRQLSLPKQRRKGRIGRSIVLIIICIIICIILLCPEFRYLLLKWLNPMAYRQYPESAEFDIQRTITINVGSSTIHYTLDMPQPKNIIDGSGDLIQNVIHIEGDPTPTSVLPHHYSDHTWLIWEDTGSGTISVAISYHMTTKTVWWDIESGDTMSVDEAMDGDAHFRELAYTHNRDEWKIMPNATEIKTLADELTQNKTNIYDRMRAVYEYMRLNFVYIAGRSGEPKDCLTTLQDKSGDCDEQSILFSALCRASGIPVWLEFGGLYDSLQNKWGGHAWAKSYIPLNGKEGENVTIDVVNGQFLFRDCNRFSEWESDGNGEHLQDYYHTFTYSPSTSTFNYNEEYQGTFTSQGTITVRLDDDGTYVLPGLEFCFIFIAIAIAIVIKKRKKQAL